jgi:hypothetical protein
MKTKFLVITAIICFSFSQTVEAQFLKKLGDRVKQKVENTVVEKTANKAAEKTSNSMDKVFNANPFGGSKENADPSLIAGSYDFSWKYSLKMTSKEGAIVFDYYLKPNAPYFGFTSATMENIFTVMDSGQKITVLFMDNQGNRMGMVNKMTDDPEIEETPDESAKFTFEQLPAKTINGYHCKGVKATNAEMEMVMYFTNEAEVSFDDIYKNQQTNIPIQLKDYFKAGDKVLMISMDMKGLKNKKMDAHIECVGLEKVSKTIRKSDYKFM